MEEAVAAGIAIGITFSVERGVGGKGYEGDSTWRQNVKRVGQGGDIESLDGGIPTEEQAKKMIDRAGGEYIRTDPAHEAPEPHVYRHVHYIVNKLRSAIQILP